MNPGLMALIEIILPPSMNAKKKHEPHQTHPAVLKRLARAIGHLQAISRMIEEHKTCPEVLQQMSAVLASIESARKVFLEDHIRGCIVEAVRKRKVDEALEELQRVLSFLS